MKVINIIIKPPYFFINKQNKNIYTLYKECASPTYKKGRYVFFNSSDLTSLAYFKTFISYKKMIKYINSNLPHFWLCGSNYKFAFEMSNSLNE